MSNLYSKGVSNWSPEPPQKDITEKLMSPNAKEQPAETNELKQFEGNRKVTASSYGTLGRRGKQF
jgi:hypothetical protein